MRKDEAKKFIRRHREKYHLLMATIYLLTAIPIILWMSNSVLLVLAISIETALATHVTGWAAEEAAPD